MTYAWKPGYVRLFASHLAPHKSDVTAVEAELLYRGYDTFGAHEAIDVTESWRATIGTALTECDAMVVFARPGFHDSPWTDQEVGWAMGRGIPVVVVWFGGDPLKGFLEQYQAIVVGESLDGPRTAEQIHQALVRQASFAPKVVDGLITSLSVAGSYVHAGAAANALDAIGDELRRSEILAILHAYRSNDQVRGAFLADRPLRQLVNRRAPDLAPEFWPTA